MTLCVGVAALVTLAFGGVTLASAGSKPSKPKPVASAPAQPKSAPGQGEATTESSPENNEGARSGRKRSDQAADGLKPLEQASVRT
jgi:hypothetical protein